MVQVQFSISWTQGQGSLLDLEFFKRGNKRIPHEKVHQTDLNLGPHDHQSNALTTRLANAAAESMENLCYLCTNLIDLYIYITLTLILGEGVKYLTLTSAILP